MVETKCNNVILIIDKIQKEIDDLTVKLSEYTVGLLQLSDMRQYYMEDNALRDGLEASLEIIKKVIADS